jgi:hypothetical protein
MRPGIIKPIHCLALLLCTLLSCCTQDDAIDVPTSVPLQLSAVIEGSGTRGDSEKNQFENGDQITITVDGDDSKSYIYQYDGSNWAPIDNGNQLLISSDATGFNITAKYTEDDGQHSFTSKMNDLVANATVNFGNAKTELRFTHEACKLLIHISCPGESGFDTYLKFDCNLSFSYNGDNYSCSYNNKSDQNIEIVAYAPPSISSLYCTFAYYEYSMEEPYYIVKDGTKLGSIEFQNGDLQAGKTYDCEFNFSEMK